MTPVAVDTVAVDPVAAPTEAGTIHFGLVELDLLATHAGVPIPYPLRVPSFGRIEGERSVLLAAAGLTMRVRGLADEAGPTGAAAEFVTALREHRSRVDLVLVDPRGTLGVVALVYGPWALVCSQWSDADTVQIRRVAASALTNAVLDMVPDIKPAVSMPLALPPRVVDAADGSLDEDRLRDLMRDSGGDPHVLDQLVGLLPTLTGRGQLGVTQGKRTELSWLDGPHGRVRVDRLDGWVSVNPLRRNDLKFALDAAGK